MLSSHWWGILTQFVLETIYRTLHRREGPTRCPLSSSFQRSVLKSSLRADRPWKHRHRKLICLVQTDAGLKNPDPGRAGRKQSFCVLLLSFQTKLSIKILEHSNRTPLSLKLISVLLFNAKAYMLPWPLHTSYLRSSHKTEGRSERLQLASELSDLSSSIDCNNAGCVWDLFKGAVCEALISRSQWIKVMSCQGIVSRAEWLPFLFNVRLHGLKYT